MNDLYQIYIYIYIYIYIKSVLFIQTSTYFREIAINIIPNMCTNKHT